MKCALVGVTDENLLVGVHPIPLASSRTEYGVNILEKVGGEGDDTTGFNKH